MNKENPTPQQKKINKLAGCLSVIYACFIIGVIIWSISILAR